jgi:hypothetical protein
VKNDGRVYTATGLTRSLLIARSECNSGCEAVSKIL